VIADLPLIDRIYSPELALENLGKATAEEKKAIKAALAESKYAEALSISEGKLENDEVEIDKEALGIIIGRDVYLSQSRIDKYLKCPFKYFGSAFLGLDENEKAEINQLVVGNFIHSVLERVFNTVIGEGRSVADLDQSEREKLTESSARMYVQSEMGGVGSAKNEVVIDRIRRAARPIVDGLCDEFANCRFTPAHCELHIDRYNADTPNSIIYPTNDGKHRVIIGGFIDRVDTLKVGNDVYVRVVDYKTGIKSFSLDDVKKGENLQMLLYLKSIVETENPEFKSTLGVGEGGKVIPAGIVYVRTSVADVTIDSPSDALAVEEVKGSFERLGASLDDPASLGAMNPDFTPMAKTKKNEAPAPLTYTLDDWLKINEDMKSSVLAIADDITGGHIVAKTNVAPGAAFHPCKDCQYKFICRNAEK
jgi:ATP-dependent helicase/nuclease subunit B